MNMGMLTHAKICSNDCQYKHDDGELESLGVDSIVSCVGCGRKCHMECHKVPLSLIKAVKSVPQNNRNFAYLGEMSYIRVVCDNCANMLMADIQNGTKPSFQSLFVIDQIMKEKEIVVATSKNNGNSNKAKRKKRDCESDNEEVNHESMKAAMKSAMSELLKSNLEEIKLCLSIVNEDLKSNTYRNYGRIN